MNIELSQAGKIRVTGEGFDPVSIYLEYIPREDGGVCGKLILESDSDAWCQYWGAMGGQKIRGFLLKASVDYIAQKLCRGKVWEIDYDKIAEKSGAEIEGQNGDTLTEEQYAMLVKSYGDDWMHNLPEMHTMEYKRVMRAVDIMKKAIKMEESSGYQQAIGRVHRQPITPDDLGGTAVKRTEDLKEGDAVNYHAVIGKGVTSTGHKIREILREPNNYGSDVAWITGKSGCVAMDALSPAILTGSKTVTRITIGNIINKMVAMDGKQLDRITAAIMDALEK